MKEKFVMTTFCASQIADASITTLALGVGFPENGAWMSRVIESGGLNNALLAKMAVTTVLIGLYTFSKENKSKYFRPVDHGLRLTGLMTWGIAAANALRLAGYLR